MQSLKHQRYYLPQALTLTNWEQIKPYFEDLKNRTISNKEELQKWVFDRSELEAVLSEDLAWRYIKMTCDTANEELLKSYQFYIQEIEPLAAPYTDELNKKLIESPLANQLDKDRYFIYLRNTKISIELFRKENIPLFTEVQTKAQQYGSINGAMTVELEGKEQTLQMATRYLKENNRATREAAYVKIQQRRLQDADQLNHLFDELVVLRNQIAKNAGFDNFRDYMFAAMCRFDYSADDCMHFHKSIQSEIVPLNREIDLARKNQLKLDPIKPWDMEVDASGMPALKPFMNGDELIDKSIICFDKVKPSFAEVLKMMKALNHLDLDSRKGKAPGGYNYPLYESNLPFIFMNSVGTLRDLVTMVHEGGHAIHSYVSRQLEVTEFKSVPSEVAELASMSMELISMEHWDVFFTNPTDLIRAKKEHLEKVLKTLPWIATVDQFQHWIYTHPNHTREERTREWVRILKLYATGVVDYSGQEAYQSESWLAQLHIFEVPFYYIEYGFAQLGAIAMWRNYKQNPELTLQAYEQALSLGYLKSIPELYKQAGIEFNFSKEYVHELAAFVKAEYDKLG